MLLSRWRRIHARTHTAPPPFRSHDHTIVGEVADDESWATLDALHALPARPGGMTMLVQKVPLQVMQGKAVEA